MGLLKEICQQTSPMAVQDCVRACAHDYIRFFTDVREKVVEDNMNVVQENGDANVGRS